MELLKEVAKDRLVIMVTHNPELAEEYSTRIVRLSDGKVIGDTNPITDTEYQALVSKDKAAVAEFNEIQKSTSMSFRVVSSSMSFRKVSLSKEEYETLENKDSATIIKAQKDKKATVKTKVDRQKLIEAKKNKMLQKAQSKKKSMSFGTAISLSFKNLLTKKGRTILTSFAGSIGIIGIALILALSNGINLFIHQVQENTLSTYPLTIQKTTRDSSAMMSTLMESKTEEEAEKDPNLIYVDNSLDKMVEAMTSTTTNDLVSFKKHLDENEEEMNKYVSDIQYTYDLDMKVYNAVNVTKDDKTETDYRELGITEMFENLKGLEGLSDMVSSAGIFNVMSEMIDNQDLLDQQYEIVAGNWPEQGKHDEVVLVVGKDNSLSKMTLYMLGILDPEELKKVDLKNYEASDTDKKTYTFDELLGMNLMLLNKSDVYVKDTSKTNYTPDGSDKSYPVWKESADYALGDIKELLDEHGIKLTVSGIIKPRKDATATSISGAIGYTKALTDKVLAMNEESEIIKQQKETPEYNVLTGLKYERTKYTPETIGELVSKVDDKTMEQFFGYMTQMILNNPEFSDRINVTKDSFAQMFFLMPVEKQAEILTSILATDGVKNAAATQVPMPMPMPMSQLDMLFSAVSQASPDKQITVTKDNITTLLPVLDPAQIYVTLTGVPETPASDEVPFAIPAIPGIVSLAGDEAMSVIYANMNETIKTMSVTEDIFLAILSTMKADDKDFIMLEDTLYKMATDVDATYDGTMKTLGAAEAAAPASINFYAKDFESKGKIEEFIKAYNTPADPENPTEEEKAKKITYTDLVGTLMSSVTVIIDVISYVLIAFVSISLVVSSIMIGIITNISVLERTKEIGILRAIGASKKDISRVFNAETFIVGLAAGILGIVITLLLCIPANAIIYALTGFANVRAVLPPVAAIILILISMALTMIAGLIPAKSASKKDPVVALRSE
jgi:putative ABC transport system permease protein